jgi:tyrosyl-tRNA synthetase
VPDDVQEVKLGGDSVAEALVKAGVIPSKAEWRRLIDGGGIKTEDDEKITDSHFKPTKTMILKVGKRRFVKVVV